MDVDKLGKGEQIAAIGGVIFLFSALFLNWFSVDLGPASDLVDIDSSATGFQAADFFRDVIYFLTAAVAIGLGVAKATSNEVNLPVAASALTAGLGILTTLLVLIRIVDPGFDGIDRNFGLFIGLIGAGLVAYGGMQSMQSEGTTFSGEADRIQDRFEDSGSGGGGGTQ